jgi:hypothetical protein
MIENIDELVSQLSEDLQEEYSQLDEHTKQLILHLDPEYLSLAIRDSKYTTERANNSIVCYAEHCMSGTAPLKFTTTNIPYMILAGYSYEEVVPLRAKGDIRVISTADQYGLEEIAEGMVKVKLQPMSADEPHQVLGPPIVVYARTKFEEGDIFEKDLTDYKYIGEYLELF